MWLHLKILSALTCCVICFNLNAITLVGDYFSYKNVVHAIVLSCQTPKDNVYLLKHLTHRDMSVSVRRGWDTRNLKVLLRHWNTAIGVLLDASCHNTNKILETCSRFALFDTVHAWLVWNPGDYNIEKEKTFDFIDKTFGNLNLSIDADIAVAFRYEDNYKLMDVFNYGKIQGNPLEITHLGVWQRDYGLNISLLGYKYNNRWDFHNLTLRGVTVILEKPKLFDPSILYDVRFTPGVNEMTKISAQLMKILKEQHNFRFNYTIVGKWIGTTDRNSSLAVSNLLYWREQDVSVTSARWFADRLAWADAFFPPITYLQTKAFYLIPDKGVGEYENRFLTPLSDKVWLSAGIVAFLCALVLFCSAVVEQHPQPKMYAICSVFAAICQQGYQDGVQLLEQAFSSQSRRLTLLVIGMTSMLLYNYYTSSVVSWLLNAAPPTIADMEGLVRSNLELIFEDTGYTRQWLGTSRIFFYSGYYNPKEAELRDVKVTKAKRTVDLYQSVEEGVELLRTGSYAYHSEPYTACQKISRRLSERELCELGALQIMPPGQVYIMGQKYSPYRHFFNWSLMRLKERGFYKAASHRVECIIPSCSGMIPRALALGQAAPAFAVLLELYCLAVLILLYELLRHRLETRRVLSTHGGNPQVVNTLITHRREK